MDKPEQHAHATRSPWWAKWVALLAVVTSLIVFWFGVVLYRAKEIALGASNRLHHSIAMAEIIDTFIRTQDPPRWPNSWEELETVEYDYNGILWPRDRAVLEANLTVNFDLTLEQVAAMDYETFDAILPNGSYVNGWRGYVMFLPETARELTSEVSPEHGNGG
jgi:hypothetical protein